MTEERLKASENPQLLLLFRRRRRATPWLCSSIATDAADAQR
jgi:hypothetical protein